MRLLVKNNSKILSLNKSKKYINSKSVGKLKDENISKIYNNNNNFDNKKKFSKTKKNNNNYLLKREESCKFNTKNLSIDCKNKQNYISQIYTHNNKFENSNKECKRYSTLKQINKTNSNSNILSDIDIRNTNINTKKSFIYNQKPIKKSNKNIKNIIEKPPLSREMINNSNYKSNYNIVNTFNFNNYNNKQISSIEINDNNYKNTEPSLINNNISNKNKGFLANISSNINKESNIKNKLEKKEYLTHDKNSTIDSYKKQNLSNQYSSSNNNIDINYYNKFYKLPDDVKSINNNTNNKHKLNNNISLLEILLHKINLAFTKDKYLDINLNSIFNIFDTKILDNTDLKSYSLKSDIYSNNTSSDYINNSNNNNNNVLEHSKDKLIKSYSNRYTKQYKSKSISHKTNLTNINSIKTIKEYNNHWNNFINKIFLYNFSNYVINQDLSNKELSKYANKENCLSNINTNQLFKELKLNYNKQLTLLTKELNDLKASFKNIQTILNNEIIKNNDLKSKLINKEKDLEIAKQEKVRDNIESNRTNKINKSFDIHEYNYKQLRRDFNLLEEENCLIREELSKVNADLNQRKEKEIKLMKLLFILRNKGIDVENIMEKEVLNKEINNLDNKVNNELNKSINQALQDSFISNTSIQSIASISYYPIYIPDNHKQVKPLYVPNLNLNMVNEDYNYFYNKLQTKNNNEDVTNNYQLNNIDDDKKSIEERNNNLTTENKVTLNKLDNYNNKQKYINYYDIKNLSLDTIQRKSKINNLSSNKELDNVLASNNKEINNEITKITQSNNLNNRINSQKEIIKLVDRDKSFNSINEIKIKNIKNLKGLNSSNINTDNSNNTNLNITNLNNNLKIDFAKKLKEFRDQNNKLNIKLKRNLDNNK